MQAYIRFPDRGFTKLESAVRECEEAKPKLQWVGRNFFRSLADDTLNISHIWNMSPVLKIWVGYGLVEENPTLVIFEDPDCPLENSEGIEEIREEGMINGLFKSPKGYLDSIVEQGLCSLRSKGINVYQGEALERLQTGKFLFDDAVQNTPLVDIVGLRNIKRFRKEYLSPHRLEIGVYTHKGLAESQVQLIAPITYSPHSIYLGDPRSFDATTLSIDYEETCVLGESPRKHPRLEFLRPKKKSFLEATRLTTSP